MVHVKPIEAAQARPAASGPGLAADRRFAFAPFAQAIAKGKTLDFSHRAEIVRF